ncbi:MAG: methyltransferase domain-containing protein [Parcubacteria group bacterium]|nr:methyltransferase domain-containing protein [Parcubacteria group bacterium]
MDIKKNGISFLIPAFNEEKNIRFALESCKWADEIFVIDNYSVDQTVAIAKEYSNVKVIQRPFDGYAAQKNWALDNLPWSNKWIFILDADEQITLLLKEELITLIADSSNDIDCWYVNRKFIFLGKWIKHCGWYPSWNLRFFKHSKARYENRAMDEHMISSGKIGYLKNDMLHEDHKGIEAWIAKHNRYSTLEANEQKTRKRSDIKTYLFSVHPIERKRAFKKLFYSLPCRPLLRFLYMYVVRLGFLDDSAGFIFCILRAVQEFYINIKLKELKLDHSSALSFNKENMINYWDKNPCGIKYCPYPEGTKEFFEFTEKRRTRLEPFVAKFAQFNHWGEKKVLEVGCGIGIDTIYFAQNGAHIYAIDISPHSVELTKKRFAYKNMQGIIATGDAEMLHFPDSEFDFVYSWGVLHHTKNTDKTIEEVRRVLKPEGKFCIMLYHKKSLVALQLYILYGLLKGKFFVNFNTLFALHLESPGTKAYTKNELQRMFNQFKDIKISTVITPYDMRIGKITFFPQFFTKIFPQSLGFFAIITGKK